MAKFLNTLCADEIGIFQGRTVHKLLRELVWENGLIRVTIPVDFETDLASVPRVPIAYLLWGDRAHREAVLHDYLYRIDAVPLVEKEEADLYFREAMIGQDNSWAVYQPMYLGVRIGGASSYHRMKVMDRFEVEK
jgi:hypothetical protein